MRNNEATIWIYPWDLQDEGVASVLDRLQENDITGLNVATLYHSGRFLLPHNPKRKVHFPEPGAIYFEPDQSWYQDSPIKPPISKFADNRFWDELREETRKRGMLLTSWIVGLHNSQMARAHPETSVVNAFGDVVEVAVDPAHPDVRAFFQHLIKDIVTNFEFDRILLESIEYMPFRHDYHHEVIGVPMTPTIEFLMSLSFSEAMLERAKETGIDVERVRTFVTTVCQEHFENPHTGIELTWEQMIEAEEGEVNKYLELRKRLNLQIIQNIKRIANSASEDITIAAIDFGPLFGMGRSGASWENGIDINQWADYIDEIHPTFYFQDEQLFSEKVADYKALMQEIKRKKQLRVVPALRAILPQVKSEQELKRYVKLLEPINEGLTFYNYGFMSFQNLSWLKQAIRQQ